MKTVTICFDVDGTLRCNCTEVCEDPNQRIVDLFNILSSFKNTKMYVWSGGGAEYAYRFANKFGLVGAQCRSKLDGGFIPDIVVDDIQDTAMGKINLIVKEK